MFYELCDWSLISPGQCWSSLSISSVVSEILASDSSSLMFTHIAHIADMPAPGQWPPTNRNNNGPTLNWFRQPTVYLTLQTFVQTFRLLIPKYHKSSLKFNAWKTKNYFQNCEILFTDNHKMRKPGSHRFRQAPLASFESFLRWINNHIN